MSEEIVVLNQDVLRECLKQIKRTIDGTGYAFTRLDCKGKSIANVPEFIAEFKHLLFVDISENFISDITQFTKLPNVISFEASQNQIESLEPIGPEPSLEACLTMSLSQNRISKLSKINVPLLRRLDLTENQIASLDETFDGHSELEWLGLAKNQLKSLDGFTNLPKLKELVLSENQIASIGTVGDLSALETLDLSGNQLTSFEGLQTIQSLKTLIVRDNQIEDGAAFKLLQQLPLLRELNAEGNPATADEEAFKLDMLLLHPRLEVINSAPITLEDRQAAKDLKEERERQRREEEEERLRLEEEAANAENNDEE